MAASPSFRNSVFRSNGFLMSTSLFYELAKKAPKGDPSKSIFSLEGRVKVNPETGKELMNARELFVSFEDVSGLQFAKQYLESYDHFKKIDESTTFKPYIKKWREEIEAVLHERSLRVVRELMSDPEVPQSTRLSAAKYIAGEGWKTSPAGSTRRGRPSKEEVSKELKEAVKKKTQEESDAARIGLKLVKG